MKYLPNLFRKLPLVLLTILMWFPSAFTHAQNSPLTITEANIQIGYVLLGQCSDVSADGVMVAVRGLGVYDLASGIERFPFVDNRNLHATFSPDGRYVQVQQHGIYRVETGELVHEIERFGIFSDNGRYIAVFRDFDELGYLYDLDEQRQVFEFSHYGGRQLADFSPDGRYLAIQGDAVYDLTTEEPHFMLEKNSGLFGYSPDGEYLSAGGKLYNLETGAATIDRLAVGWDFHPSEPLVIANNGVYTFSGQHVLQTSSTGFFSPDGRYVAFHNDGVYEVGTWNRLFDIQGSVIEFNAQGSLLLVDRYPEATGWYDLATSEYRELAFSPQFSHDGVLITDRFCTSCPALDPLTGALHYQDSGYGIFTNDRRYMVSNDYFKIGLYEHTYCRVYSAASSEWSNRTGQIIAQDVNVHEAPRTTSWTVTSGSGQWLVAARNPEADWYLVRTDAGIYGWVSASLVRVVNLPDELPIV